MCSTFAQLKRVSEYQKHFKAKTFLHKVEEYLKPNYRLRPRSVILSVVASRKKRCFTQLNWGFKNPMGYHPFINARVETVLEKKTFKKPFMTSRCLIPVDGFYEMNQKHQWYYIRLKSKETMAVAGIFRDEKNGYRSCPFLTCEPNRALAKAQDRMLVILPEKNWDPWLGIQPGEEKKLLAMCLPYPAKEMEVYQINSPLKKSSGRAFR